MKEVPKLWTENKNVGKPRQRNRGRRSSLGQVESLKGIEKSGSDTSEHRSRTSHKGPIRRGRETSGHTLRRESLYTGGFRDGTKTAVVVGDGPLSVGGEWRP